MKQIYGIDLSKKKLDMCFEYENGVNRHKTICNNLSRLSAFLEQLPSDSILCAEYTGTPCNLLRFLAHVNQIPLILITGYEVKHGLGLQKGKSDKIDAKRIKEYAERFYDKLEFVVFEGEALFELQELYVVRNQLVKQLFEIRFFIPFDQFIHRSNCQNVASMHDRDSIAQSFDFAHDVSGKDQALALVS